MARDGRAVFATVPPDRALLFHLPECDMNKSPHLYIMQASDGRIKIGRSGNPEQRRKQIVMLSGLPVFIVLVLPDRGDDELDIQGEMWRYNTRIGEWFEGTLEAQNELRAILGCDIKFPYIERPRRRPAKKTLIPRTGPVVKKYLAEKPPGGRRVIRKLADGTIKEYFYPRFNAFVETDENHTNSDT